MERYINLCAKYSAIPNDTCGYTSIKEILEEMDRLGIWQTVVEYPTGANALQRNRRLLADLEKIPGWEKRIIPSFMLDASTAVQRGAMAQIIAMLETYRPSCITWSAGKVRLRDADMALDEVRHLNPVVLLDCKDIKDAEDDLVYLANRYPDMRFVIRRVMWNKYPIVFDVMRRAGNIYVDNSWIHTKSGLEMFTQFFGQERVLFSLGYRANGGAAMAAITYADMPEENKDKIRHGNFIRLFPNEADRKALTNNLKAIPNRVANSYWTDFVEGRGAPDVEIYDVHTHMGTIGNDWYLLDATFESQIAAFEEDMEKFRVRKIVSSVSGRPDLIDANCEMEQAVRGKEDRFLGYLRYDPNYADLYTDEYLDARFRGPYFVGLKTLPAYMGVDIRDKRYEGMFRYADAHGLPILIHCWDGTPGDPWKCAEAAARWPNAKLILGHTGGSGVGRQDCEAISQDPKYGNVWFEFCGSFTSTRRWEDTLQHMDYRRVLYGTDACLHGISWEMGRLLSADIPDEQLRAILGENAKALFGF